jgi:PAS domain S-box-containing protein
MEIIKFRSQLFHVSEQVTVDLRLAQNTLRLPRSAVDRSRRLQKALRARENDLRKLLASSPDAIVVTNVNRRFVAANPKGLNLFGVSEANLKKFTIDAFLSHGHILSFSGHGSPFIRREKRHGECKIRRLDGSLRVAVFSSQISHLIGIYADSVTLRLFDSDSLQHSTRATAVIERPASYTEDTRNWINFCQVPVPAKATHSGVWTVTMQHRDSERGMRRARIQR